MRTQWVLEFLRVPSLEHNFVCTVVFSYSPLSIWRSTTSECGFWLLLLSIDLYVDWVGTDSTESTGLIMPVPMPRGPRLEVRNKNVVRYKSEVWLLSAVLQFFFCACHSVRNHCSARLIASCKGEEKLPSQSKYYAHLNTCLKIAHWWGGEKRRERERS